MKLLQRCLRHLWLDADDALRAVGEAGIGRLEARVRASEQVHSGQICLCVEASLPPCYLWRHVARGESIEDVVRDRALTLFGKQRVWDTEHNNGVLVYLLLAEHRIEIVADRGLSGLVSDAQWRGVCQLMEELLRAGGHANESMADGVVAGIEAAGDLLAEHFPQEPGMPDEDELPDQPVFL